MQSPKRSRDGTLSEQSNTINISTPGGHQLRLGEITQYSLAAARPENVAVSRNRAVVGPEDVEQSLLAVTCLGSDNAAGSGPDRVHWYWTGCTLEAAFTDTGSSAGPGVRAQTAWAGVLAKHGRQRESGVKFLEDWKLT